MSAGTRPGLLFYCQHSVGLGHLVRSLTLAGGLAERFEVTFLSGGPIPAQLSAPAGVRLVQLPPLGHDDSYELISRDPRYTVQQACELRLERILAEFELTRPVVLLIELYPFGRKKFSFELRPLLDLARRPGPDGRRPVTVCSLRDILVGSRRDQQRHDDRAAALTNEFFDAVLVHADPAFARLEETFRPTVPLRVPVHYTGFVRPPRPEPAAGPGPARRPRVIVSAGGGLVGEPLFRAAVQAHPTWQAQGLSTLLVTGPFLPAPTRAALHRVAAGTSGLEVVEYLPDLAGEIAASAVSVSQVGYNTTMDLLGSGTPAVVVPYREGKEDEQAERSRRLHALGLVELPAGALDGAPTGPMPTGPMPTGPMPTGPMPTGPMPTGPALAQAVLAARYRTPPPLSLALDGRERTGELLAELARPTRQPDPVSVR
jgi:predicted glycosyltransferase